MASDNDQAIHFLQWALPRLGYRWKGFRKPRGQVLKRIRGRMQELGLSGGYPAYRTYLKRHPEEWRVLDRLCDVTISKFFRDRKLWDYLLDQILRELLQSGRSGPVSIWSAGCCNGEEAFSVSVISYQLLGKPPTKNKIFILATDRNAEVLSRAREGRYPAGALKELRDEEIERFFHPVEDDSGDDFRIDGRLSRCIEFERRDIRDSLPDRVFDLVFCRNLVFTYFSEEEQRRFLDRLRPHVAENGYLVIGSNEVLPEDVEWLRAVNNAHPVFVRKGL